MDEELDDTEVDWHGSLADGATVHIPEATAAGG